MCSITECACFMCDEPLGVLFTGAGEQVRDEDGTTLYCNDGTPRVGRGLAATTFRKHYHALRTLHVHFQQDSISKVGYILVKTVLKYILIGRRMIKLAAIVVTLAMIQLLLYPYLFR